MPTIELVEQLRKHANVSYRDAKEALEASDNDILEAIIYLESQGKVAPPQGGSYSTQKQKANNKTYNVKPDVPRETLGDLIGKFFTWLRKVVTKGNRNSFVVRRYSKHVFAIPITILVLLIIACFWVSIPLLIIGLLFGYKYSFSGPDIKSDTINEFMDKASDTAENIKDDFKQNKNSSDNKPDKETEDE